MAKTTGKAGNKPAFASLNPDDMLAGGLPSDFRGTVTDAAYVKWDYEGTSDRPVLAVRLNIHPDADSGLDKDIVQHWSAGDLAAWAPADEDGDVVDEGPYAVRVGKRAEMSNNTNFAHLMQTILESGEAAKGKPFGRKQLTSSIACLVGLDAHWDRVPQKQRKGMADLTEATDGEDKPRPSKRDILVVTEVFGYDPDGAAEEEAPAKKPVKTTKTAVVEDEDEAEPEAAEDEAEELSPLDLQLTKAIVKAINAAGGSLKKGKLAALVLKAFATDKNKNKAVSRSAEEEFLSASAAWSFDEDTGVLSIED